MKIIVKKVRQRDAQGGKKAAGLFSAFGATALALLLIRGAAITPAEVSRANGLFSVSRSDILALSTT